MSSTVEDWLRSLGLIQYTQAFLDNGYDDLEICKEIGEEDLDAIGVRNIKDRVDILSAVLRLKQSGTAVYFVLEEGTQPTVPTQVREKLIPLKLKVLLRDTLKDDSIDLTEAPYTLPNGACGNLDNLVTLYADKFYTYEEDVLDALENIRERQVGDLKSLHGSKKDEGDEGFDSSPSHKNKHKRSNTTPLPGVAKESSPLCASHSTLNAKGIPADYLDVDSTSPHKKVKRRRPVERNSNLSRSLDSLKELHINPSELKTKDKNQQTSKPKQSSSIFGLFRSSKRKSPGHDDKSYDTKSLNDIHVGKPVAGADLPASYITMGEEDRVALMLMVKQGELTVEEAVQQLESYEKENKKKQATKKDMRRSGSCSEEDSNIKPVKIKKGIFGRSTKKKSSSRPASEIAACDMTMSEEDRINLMKGVRDHKITIEEAIQKLLSYEEESPGHKVKVNKHKFSPKSPHSFSRLSIKRVSNAFGSGKNAPSKDEKTSVFYTPTEGTANTSSEGCSEDENHWPSDSSPDPSPAGHRKVMHNLIRGAKQIHSTSSLHSSSSSSDAVDRLGTIEDLEAQETSFSKGSRTSPEKRMVNEMKTILSRREQEETSKKRKDVPTVHSSPIHASTLPRNGKPTQNSLSRKSSLPITTSPPPSAVRKPPPPPPRPLPRQSTMPLIVPRASESKPKNEADMATKPKPPKYLPRRKSFGDNSRTTEHDIHSKLTDTERSLSSQLPLPPHPPPKPEDSKGGETFRDSEEFSDLPSPPETVANSRMSLEDDVFPPLPPEHMLSSLRPVSQVEVEYKKVIVKPPRPSLLKHIGDGDASHPPVGRNKTTGALKQRNLKEEASSDEERNGLTGHMCYPEDSGSSREAGGMGSPAHTGSPVHTGSPTHTGSPVHTGSPTHIGSLVHTGSPAHTGSQAETGSPRDSGSPKDSGSPTHTTSSRHSRSPGQTGSQEQEDHPVLPVTKPKPPVKRKPQLPPKPPKPTPGASSGTQDEGKKKADSSIQAVDQQSELNVMQVPQKRPSHSLSDLIERRLRIEQIDLTELPYSTIDGRWEVPINLIDRYTEEMRRSQKEIVEIMDRIRCSKLKQKSRPAIACDVSLYPQQPDNLGKLTSLEDWLVSLGLPMYLDNLKEVEYDNMATMPYLKQKHFEYAGVVNLRHMRRLLASVERMPKTIIGPS